LGKFDQLVAELPLVVAEVNVKGKFMYWTFSKDDKPKFYMFSTFGMTGQWSPTEGKHPCFEFGFTDGSKIFFNDPRHFGTIKFTDNKQDLTDKLAELGWDPFTPLKDKLSFIVDSLADSNKSISEDLMNQKLFSGVGNYIRAEALYASEINPWTLSKNLTKDKVFKLCDAIVKVMEESYSHQGATISTYKDAYGAEGKYTSCFKVYGKKIDSNGYKIIKEKSGDGRTIHWCPDIQK
jgi:DNA-formamidopyrimidine glycosylase